MAGRIVLMSSMTLTLPSVPIMGETTASWFITVQGKEIGINLERFQAQCSVLGAMPTLAVGRFPRENRHLATRAWSWHPLHSR